MIQSILLSNNQLIIAQVFSVDADPGEPNCRLMDPYLFTLSGPSNVGFRLTPWMEEVTDTTECMIHPDKIITMRDPKPEVLQRYKKIILIDEDEILDDTEEEVFEGNED
jgi:hypothetical protein